VQPGRIAGRVLAQIGHGAAQLLDEPIEDLPHAGQVGFFPQYVEEPRNIPLLGHLAFRFDADQPTEFLVATQLGQAGIGRGVSQQVRQQDHAPKDMYRVIVASPPPLIAEAIEQWAVGNRLQELSDGLQTGAEILSRVVCGRLKRAAYFG